MAVFLGDFWERRVKHEVNGDKEEDKSSRDKNKRTQGRPGPSKTRRTRL